MRRPLICLALAMVLLLSCFTGVFAKTKNGVDISKPVKLYGYLMGSAPAGMADMMAELNKKLKKDLNCTMEINYIGWGDMQAKYPLVLAAGEDVDWVYTANWCFYFQESAKGAFMEISQDMLKKYMPKHFKATNSVAWKEALINGKVYMIPTSTPDRKVGATIIRGDLRKKYGVPEIKKFSDMEKYLEAIKKNEPGMIPMSLDNSFDIGRPWSNLYYDAGPFWTDILSTTGSGCGVVYDPEDPEGKLYMCTEEPVVSYLKNAAKIMKAWNEKDYFNKDAFANKVRSKEAFDHGKSAVGFGNSVDIQSNLANAQAKGWEVEVIPQLSAKGHYPADPYINNGVAITARSKNWQRTMMALDLIMEDPVYDYLVYFGIQGKNYIIKNGKVDLPPGLAADKNTYPPDAAGFWFTNKDLFKPMASWPSDYIKLRSNVKTMLAPNVFAALAINTDSIKTEVANLNQILIQYTHPIGLGMVDDIDKAFATLEEKLKAAGIEKVKAEMTKQTKAYLNSLK
jgi:putative aldouronate transport system substrate-binding protein